MIGKHYKIILLSFALIVLNSCSVGLPVKAVNDYYTCSYDEAYDTFIAKAQSAKDKDKAVFYFAALSAAFSAQRYQDVVRIGSQLVDFSWSNEVGKKQGKASLLSAQALRYYKGEPFEKAMVSIYTGLALYQLGQYDNARASFAKANLAIANKYKKTGESDFALSLFLLAWMYAQQGELDNANIVLKKASARFPDNPYLKSLKQLQQNNVLVIQQRGLVPKKTMTGPGDSMVAWAPRSSNNMSRPSISLNKLVSYDLFEVGDLYYQATSKQATGQETVQAVKGTLREAAVITAVAASHQNASKEAKWVALGAGLFAIANQSQADTRQWELLPEKFYMANIKLEPGKYQVLSSAGQEFEIEITANNPAKILFIQENTCKPMGSKPQ
ncbi:MAG TPA: tetratricopeptide repeat protein [Oligoflexia bacterium]|nr:tetratricopeptide repeat protein [Oligoflexia bacterium]HMR25421.1 tetratricopeptide repeat protein [Oligoflexia bacterium]